MLLNDKNKLNETVVAEREEYGKKLKTTSR